MFSVSGLTDLIAGNLHFVPLISNPDTAGYSLPEGGIPPGISREITTTHYDVFRPMHRMNIDDKNIGRYVLKQVRHWTSMVYFPLCWMVHCVFTVQWCCLIATEAALHPNISDIIPNWHHCIHHPLHHQMSQIPHYYHHNWNNSSFWTYYLFSS